MANDEFEANLAVCGMGDQGCKYLVSGLQKCLDTDSVVTTLLSMNIEHNGLGNHGVCYLSSFLKIGCFRSLDMGNFFLITDNDDEGISSLHYHNNILLHGSFPEHLRKNTTLKELILWRCGITPSMAERLAETLADNKHMEILDISRNEIHDDGIQHIAQVLRVNQSLKIPIVCGCGITDVGLEQIATSLVHNKTLVELHLSEEVIGFSDILDATPNYFTYKIVPVLSSCLRLNLTLTKLGVNLDLSDSDYSIYDVQEAVNAEREKSRLPLIQMEGSDNLKFACNIF